MQGELTTSEVVKLLGISPAQLHRYGDEGKINFRPHGPRGRRRYNIEQLRRDAAALQLPFSEETGTVDCRGALNGTPDLQPTHACSNATRSRIVAAGDYLRQ